MSRKGNSTMPANKHPLALRSSPALLTLLEQCGALDKPGQKALAEQVAYMVYWAKESQAAQDAVSFLYTYSVAKATDTLTVAELLKAVRSPLAPGAELDGL